MEQEAQNLTASGATAAIAAHAEVKDEHTLYAEPLFHIGSFPVTNSILNSWIVVLLIIIISLAVKFKLKEIPGRIQSVFEMVIEWFLGVFDTITGSRKRSLQFFPLVFSFFIFILLMNWMGLLPGFGSIGLVVQQGNEKLFVPYLRGGTADLNTTLALAIIGVVFSHIFGVAAVGIWKHINKFVNLRAIAEIPKKIRKDPAVLLINPINVFVGFIEIIGEFAKVASLSFRLFGNVYAGEVLLASMAAILAFGLPIPFMFLEVIVGLVQALIFAMLILAYLTINTSAEEH